MHHFSTGTTTSSINAPCCPIIYSSAPYCAGWGQKHLRSLTITSCTSRGHHKVGRRAQSRGKVWQRYKGRQCGSGAGKALGNETQKHGISSRLAQMNTPLKKKSEKKTRGWWMASCCHSSLIQVTLLTAVISLVARWDTRSNDLSRKSKRRAAPPEAELLRWLFDLHRDRLHR